MKKCLKRYWKAIAICLVILAIIGLGIKGLNIKTVDEYASSKAQVVEETPEETSNTESNEEDNSDKDKTSEESNTEKNDAGNEAVDKNKTENEIKSSSITKSTSSSNGKSSDTTKTQPQNDQPKQEVKAQQEKSYCTISIDCQTILNNMQDLKENKKPYVPESGYIFSGKVEIKEGQTVMDVLLSLPGVNVVQTSGYVVSINNLKEKDCGRYSGWMYNVNGTYPNYGCAEYKVQNGDNIQWRYTCNLGNDLGAGMN
ncbi:MAG: DUF4430 domain-containing protein [Clostridiaceae bacterium]|nr:DUF4430 domain-containing protein [Clostridiaceae bacterium]